MTRNIRGTLRGSLKNLIQNVFTTKMKSELDFQYLNAMNETAKTFNFFINAWNSFFNKLNLYAAFIFVRSHFRDI